MDSAKEAKCLSLAMNHSSQCPPERQMLLKNSLTITHCE